MSRKIKNQALAAFVAGRITRDEYIACVRFDMVIRGRALYRVVPAPFTGWRGPRKRTLQFKRLF